MSIHYPSDAQLLRQEIAASAARMIAEDGLDYGTAKRKAVKQVLGNQKIRGNVLPENSEIEEEVRQYNALFFGDSQPARLLQLRKVALDVMEELAPFNPCITGAVLNRTAGEHSDIHLQLFSDNPKDVEMALLNRGIDFDVSEIDHFRKANRQVEVITFLWKQEGVHLMLYDTDDVRGAMKASVNKLADRADAAKLRFLIAEST